MNQWMLIRLILLVIFVAVLIPAIRLMRQVEDMEKTTGKKSRRNSSKSAVSSKFCSVCWLYYS